MHDTDTNRHPFLDDLTPDAELTGTVLRKPVRGRDNVRRVVDAVRSHYASQTPTFVADPKNRTFLQYDAVLRNGLKLQAVAVIERNEDGSVPRVSVTMGPLSAALSLAAGLGATLEGEIDADHFL